MEPACPPTVWLFWIVGGIGNQELAEPWNWTSNLGELGPAKLSFFSHSDQKRSKKASKNEASCRIFYVGLFFRFLPEVALVWIILCLPVLFEQCELDPVALGWCSWYLALSLAATLSCPDALALFGGMFNIREWKHHFSSGLTWDTPA